MMKSVVMGAALGAMLVSGAASAQQAGAPQAGRPEVKTVEDWFVRCFQIQSPSPCDMYQELDNRETRQRILSLSIAYVPSLDRHALQITVPLEIAIQKGLVIQTDSYKSPVLKYRRCDRNGCYVEQAVDNTLVEGLARSGAAGKVNIVADNGKAFSLNFSLKGFAAAHDDMVAQARSKAKAVEKPAEGAPAAKP
jgi:invasion protein IalB